MATLIGLYLYEVTSDTRGYHGDTCRSGDDHVVRLAALIGRAWFGWRDVWGPRGRRGLV